MIQKMKILWLSIVIWLFAFHAFAQDSDIKVLLAVGPENYPTAAKTVYASGNVKVKVEISNDGNVISAESVGGHPLLRAVSVESAKMWKFSAEPGASEKRFTILTFNYNFEFALPRATDSSEPSRQYILSNIFSKPFQVNVIVTVTDLIPIINILPRVENQLEEKYCNLHKVKMKTEIVDIIYGLMLPTKGFEDIFKTEQKKFPNANKAVYAGCIVEIAEKEEVYYCEKCRKARNKWLNERKLKLGLAN
jgi:hypothetical protein